LLLCIGPAAAAAEEATLAGGLLAVSPPSAATSAINLTEGGGPTSTAQLNVSLATVPNSSVTVLVVPADPARVSTATAAVVFGVGDWNASRPIQLAAVDDLYEELVSKS
jgi:hypothetical protein